jgi:hypothetical protein
VIRDIVRHYESSLAPNLKYILLDILNEDSTVEPRWDSTVNRLV